MNKPQLITATAYHFQDIIRWLKQKHNVDVFEYHDDFAFIDRWYVTRCECDGDRCNSCFASMELQEIWIDPEHYPEDWAKEVASIIKKEFYPEVTTKTTKVWIGDKNG